MVYRDGFKKGCLELIVLHILSVEDSYGYEICQKIEEWSGNLLTCPEGSLYPALYKLEQLKFVTQEKRLVGKRRERVYYSITDEGRSELKKMEVAINETIEGIQNIMNTFAIENYK